MRYANTIGKRRVLCSDRNEKFGDFFVLFSTAVSISISPEQLFPVFLDIYTPYQHLQYRLIAVKSIKYSKFT